MRRCVSWSPSRRWLATRATSCTASSVAPRGPIKQPEIVAVDVDLDVGAVLLDLDRALERIPSASRRPSRNRTAWSPTDLGATGSPAGRRLRSRGVRRRSVVRHGRPVASRRCDRASRRRSSGAAVAGRPGPRRRRPRRCSSAFGALARRVPRLGLAGLAIRSRLRRALGLRPRGRTDAGHAPVLRRGLGRTGRCAARRSPRTRHHRHRRRTDRVPAPWPLRPYGRWSQPIPWCILLDVGVGCGRRRSGFGVAACRSACPPDAAGARSRRVVRLGDFGGVVRLRSSRDVGLAGGLAVVARAVLPVRRPAPPAVAMAAPDLPPPSLALAISRASRWPLGLTPERVVVPGRSAW